MLQTLQRMNVSGIKSIPESDFPADGSPTQKLAFAAKYASLAPTEINWQPWKFRLTDTHLDLRTKNDPVQEVIDPDGRECMIGCGSALQYLTVAMKHFGCLGPVTLFPDLGEPELVARIQFGTGRDRQVRHLFDAMAGTRVSQLGEMPVSEAMLVALGQAASGERGWLDFVLSEAGRQQLVEMAQANDHPWVNTYRSGLQANNEVAGGPPAASWRRSFLAFGDRAIDPEDALDGADEPAGQEPVPAAILGLVKTKTDDKHGWLAAGQAMARTILQAQALGLSWAFFDPVRQRSAREALRMGVGHKGFAQVILRFGSLMAGHAPAEAAIKFRFKSAQ